MAVEREDITSSFSDEELEALAGEEVPDREAMSKASAEPSDFVDLELDAPPPETPPDQ